MVALFIYVEKDQVFSWKPWHVDDINEAHYMNEISYTNKILQMVKTLMMLII
jgi:hypothetical protein